MGIIGIKVGYAALIEPKSNSYHRINLPRMVLVGENVIKKIGSICHEFNYKNALIVTGKKTYKVAGKKTQELLGSNDINTCTTMVSEATRETVNLVKAQIESCGADVVLGIGGGRNIDIAKISSHEMDRVFISVPTVASHDGIASNLASLKGSMRPYSVSAASPIAVVIDSKIIQESPYRFTAAGCGDMICKVVEVRDWRLAHKEKNDYYGVYAGSLSLMSSQHVMENAELIRKRTQEGIRTLLEALVSCGVAMSIAGSSRPTSGSSHLFSHALDQISEKPALHGEQCGVGSIIMAKLHGLNWVTIRESLRTIGAPISAKELGVSDNTIIKALMLATSIRPERYTILNKIRLDEKLAIELAESTYVI
jgi:glycerol-1-phosphate dehydrogenase [NAD(P)+]